MRNRLITFYILMALVSIPSNCEKMKGAKENGNIPPKNESSKPPKVLDPYEGLARIQGRELYGFLDPKFGVRPDVHVLFDRRKANDAETKKFIKPVDVEVSNGPDRFVFSSAAELCNKGFCVLREKVIYKSGTGKVLVKYIRINENKIKLTYVDGEGGGYQVPRGIYQKLEKDPLLYR